MSPTARFAAHRRSVTLGRGAQGVTTGRHTTGSLEPRSLIGRAAELGQLDRLLASVRDGASTALVVRGEPGLGKSALLDRLAASASGFTVVRAAGVEGEVDLPYAGLQQLCRSMLHAIPTLPEPQARSLNVAFGLAAGDLVDRYLVGLAVLSLLSEAASARPLLCIVDDAQWLDPASTLALAFVARRLGNENVALVLASRVVVDELKDIPELELAPLGTADSAVLLESALIGRLDERVRERLLAESRGNPLALLELPKALTPAEAATGILHRVDGSLSERLEAGFRSRLEHLPEDSRRLLLLAAAEPLGDPLLLFRAATQLGLAVEAKDAAEEVGLLEIDERTSFRHPLVRSAVYGVASHQERRLVHGALADCTDGDIDPDRRAWHRAQATAAPDEEVAADLEATAVRAKARGGLAASGAFLERAAMLSPDPGKRIERALAACEVLLETGAFDAVEKLLRTIEPTRLDDLAGARLDHIRARIALAFGRDEAGAIRRLLAAADRLGRVEYLQGQRATWRFNSGSRTCWRPSSRRSMPLPPPARRRPSS
jgi:hypothetical protein